MMKKEQRLFFKIIKKIGDFIQKHPNFDYFLLAILGLHIFLGFKDQFIYMQGDWLIPLDPLENLRHMFTWRQIDGGVTSWAMTAWSLFGFFALFKALALPLYLIERLYIYFGHTLAAFGMYYLASSVTFPKERNRTICLMAAFFYMFNLLIVDFVTLYVHLPYTVMPFILGFWIRGLHSPTEIKNFVKYSLLINLFLFGIVIDLPQYKMSLVMAFMLLTYTLFYLTFLKGSLKHTLKFILTGGSVTLLLNLWFLLPYTSYLKCGGFGTLTAPANIIFGDYGYSTIRQLFRLLGNAAFDIIKYFQPYKSNPLMVLITYSIPLLAWGALLFKKKSKPVFFFAFFSLIFIFLAKGTNPPLGNFYKWAVLNIPLARAFNTSHVMAVGIAMGYAYLIGHTTSYLLHRLQRNIFLKITFLGTICLILLIAARPLLTGAYLENIANPPTYEGFKIPSSYVQANEFFSEKRPEDFNILLYPRYSGGTTWGYGGGFYVYTFLITKPLILNVQSFYGTLPTSQAIREMVFFADRKHPQKKAYFKLHRLLNLLNIRYIILDSDVYTSQEIFLKYLAELRTQTKICRVKTIDNLIIYENLSYRPHIYTSPYLTLVRGRVDALLPLTRTTYLNGRPCLLFSEQLESEINNLKGRIYTLITFNEKKLSVKSLPFKVKTAPILSYQKINPTRYLIRVKAREPFWLVFSESFHEGWRAYLKPVNSEQFTVNRKNRWEWSALVGAWKDRDKRVELKEHYVVNGYANGWWVPIGQFEIKNEKLKIENIENKPEEFEIVLEFVPQRLFEVGVLISGLTLLGCVAYLLGTKIKRLRRKAR